MPSDPIIGEAASSYQDIDWDCLRVRSPAGLWYIIQDEADRAKYETDRASQKARAVFSRSELHILNPYWQKMSNSERQQDLKILIDIKETLGGYVESINEVKGGRKVPASMPAMQAGSVAREKGNRPTVRRKKVQTVLPQGELGDVRTGSPKKERKI